MSMPATLKEDGYDYRDVVMGGCSFVVLIVSLFGYGAIMRHLLKTENVTATTTMIYVCAYVLCVALLIVFLMKVVHKKVYGTKAVVKDDKKNI
jgi:drug/metabolite transporter (DMT)-like permease